MVENPHIWHVWARNLHRWGMEAGAAILLEAAGPLTMLLAQFIYISQPLLGKVISSESLDALSQMLEEPTQTKEFIKVLREAA